MEILALNTFLVPAVRTRQKAGTSANSFWNYGKVPLVQKWLMSSCKIPKKYTIYKYNLLKGLVHPKINITPCFTHPQGLLGVYDFLLSDESNWSHIKNCPGTSSVRMGVGGCFCSTVHK